LTAVDTVVKSWKIFYNCVKTKKCNLSSGQPRTDVPQLSRWRGRRFIFAQRRGIHLGILRYFNRRQLDAKKKQVPYKHRQFFESLLPYYETVQYIFVHAGLEPGISLKSQETETMIWIRHEFIDTDYHFGKTVIFGHTPMTEPLITDNKIGIDTGAVYGGKLTCLELPEIKIHQV